ncbi:hypothetical protein EOD23_13840 [Mesorhizobium sp. USDA-HM6]|nr:hypothetical protein EOD23_13840 [Mesorhizobium sp. USDA-HM6]
MFRNLLAAARRLRGDQLGRFTEFQRNEDRAKIGADKDRGSRSIGYNMHGWPQSCWSATHSARTQVAIHCRPWGIFVLRIKGCAMGQVLHGSATTREAIRRAIPHSRCGEAIWMPDALNGRKRKAQALSLKGGA